MTVVKRWLYALKPASWPKLLVPMLLGQAIGVAAAPGQAKFGGVLFGVTFTVLDLAFVVLLNDYFDRDVDALKRRMFPHGCSPKTIADRILPASHVLVGGLVAGALALGVAALAARTVHAGILPAAALSLLVFVSYSLPPLRLNYRGGGELLEMLGVGFVLPWLNAYAVSGRVLAPALPALGGFALCSLASAIASGLSDEESDRAGGKRTLVTLRGNARSRVAIDAFLAAGAGAWLVGALVLPLAIPLSAALPACAVLVGYGWRARRLSRGAVTNAFSAQSAYKAELHRAIWGSALAFAALLTALSLL